MCKKRMNVRVCDPGVRSEMPPTFRSDPVEREYVSVTFLNGSRPDPQSTSNSTTAAAGELDGIDIRRHLRSYDCALTRSSSSDMADSATGVSSLIGAEALVGGPPREGGSSPNALNTSALAHE